MVAGTTRGLFAALVLAGVVSADFTVTILITREVRGAAFPIRSKWTGEACNNATIDRIADPSTSCECLAGAARRQIHVSPSDTATTNRVTLDVGSYFSGSGKFYAAFEGNVSAELFARAGYSAFGLSYRDFSSGGPLALSRYLGRIRTFWPDQSHSPRATITNIDLHGETLLSPFLQPFEIIALADGRRMAVLSLTDPTHLAALVPEYASRLTPFWQSLAVNLAALRRSMAGLPEVVAVMITAMPVTDAEVEAAGGRYAAEQAATRRLVDEAIGVDIFILGIYSIDPGVPRVHRNWAGDDVLVVPARNQVFGTTIDNVTAVFSDAGLLDGNASAVEQISLEGCRTAPEDAPIAALLDRYEARQVAILGQPVGAIGEALDSQLKGERSENLAVDAEGGGGSSGLAAGCVAAVTGSVLCGCRVASCKQGAFVADAIRFAADADLSLVNAGAIRSTLSSGSVSAGDIIQLLPFANELVRVPITGADLRTALTNSISQLGEAFFGDSGGSGRFAQVSGSLRFDWYFASGQPTLSTVIVWARDAPGCSLADATATLTTDAQPGHACWRPLNDTATYSLAVNAYLKSGGDGYSMLADLPGEMLGINSATATSSYLAAWQQAGGAPVTVGAYGSRIIQQPDLIVVEVGAACKTSSVGNGEGLAVLAADREECDHLRFMAELINDKADGFLDELLPNTYIRIEEARIGCVESLGPSVVAELASRLPNMVALIGAICSNDVADIANVAFRADTGNGTFDGIVLSSSSTAPSLADEDAYPKLARLATSEAFVGRGSSLLAERWAWNRVAVVHDDSLWATEGAQAFVAEHEARSGVPVLNQEHDGVVRSFAVDGFTAAHAKKMLLALEAMEARIVYLIAQPRLQTIIWAAVYEENLLSGEGYAWITAWPSETAFVDANGRLAPNAVRGAEGTIGLLESTGEGTPMHEAYIERWRTRASPAGCDGREPQYCDADGSATEPPPGYSIQQAESLLLLAKALDTNLRNAAFRSDPGAVFAAIKQLGQEGYKGPSGNVVLSSAADRLGNFDVRNMQVSVAASGRRRLSEGGESIATVAHGASALAVPPRFAFAHGFAHRMRMRRLAINLATSSAGYVKVGTWAATDSAVTLTQTVLFPGGTNEAPDDEAPPGHSAANVVGAIAGSLAGALLVTAVIVWVQRRHNKRIVRALHTQLQELKDSAVGMRYVNEVWDPRDEMNGASASAQGGHGTGLKTRLRSTVANARAANDLGLDAASAAAIDSAAAVAELPPIERATWYWQEDESNIGKHAPHTVLQPGNFVEYAGQVCKELDRRHAEWTTAGALAGSTAIQRIDLTDRIHSTGTEQKVHNQHTGVTFDIDFAQMVQRNVKSGFTRQVQRVVQQQAVAAETIEVQTTTKQRPDGWAFGKVIYDEQPERGQAGADFASSLRWRRVGDTRPDGGQPLSSESLAQALQQRTDFAREEFDSFGVGAIVPNHFVAVGRSYYQPVVTTYSFQAGWFPLNHTDVPSPQQLQELQKQLGGDGASDALKEPNTWAPMADPLAPKLVKLTPQHGDEMERIQRAFMATHDQRCNRSKKWQIVSVERVQNVSMWQSYAVKRQTILRRDNALGDAERERAIDKEWLFHGTDTDTVSKIIEMGFNRSFAGKNAVRYGKGVYFARDASYSDNYAKEDAKGLRRMFLCRVVVGQWCLGHDGRLVPDVRIGQTLYDSTVNNMADPIMWVTYHDAQAYPEYLIMYRHT